MQSSSLYPEILEFSPTVSDQSVGVSPHIVTLWNTDIDDTQFSDAQRLSDLVNLYAEPYNVPVGMAFVSYLDRTLTLEPAASLVPGTVYRITFEEGIRGVAPANRAMRVSKSWHFRVADQLISNISLLSPADSTAYAVVPTLSWTSAVVSGGLGAGTLFYSVLIDRSPTFASLQQEGWSTLTTETSALSDMALEPGHTYYWRVQPILTGNGTGAASGAVSSVFAFYLGTELQPSPSTRQTYVPLDDFFVEHCSFDRVPRDDPFPQTRFPLCNLAAYPTIQLTFSTPPDPATASNFIQNAKMHQVGRIDTTATMSEEGLSGTWGFSGNIATFAPGEGLKPVYKYIFRLDPLMLSLGGKELGESYEFVFTSQYHPLYTNVNSIRSEFGELLMNMEDDLICQHIYRASLDAVGKWVRGRQTLPYIIFDPMITVPQPMTDTMIFDNNTPFGYYMARWTLLRASRSLLILILREAADRVGTSRKAGDFTIDVNDGILGLINAEIARIKDELIDVEREIIGEVPIKSVSKGEMWDPIYRDLDGSLRWSRRTKPTR